MENIIIKFSADITELKPAVDILRLIPGIATQSITAFDKLKPAVNESSQAMHTTGKSIEQMRTQLEKLVVNMSEAFEQEKIEQYINALNEGSPKIQSLLAEAEQLVVETEHLKKGTEEYADAMEKARNLGKQIGNEMHNQIGQKETETPEVNTEKITSKVTTLKAQLKALKAEMAALPEGSVNWIQIAIEAGKMEDKIGDVNARVKYLASDTKGFDAVMGAAQGVTAAFSIAQGAAALYGGENEELQKTLLHVQGSMAVLSGLEQLNSIVKNENALKSATMIANEGVLNFIRTGSVKAIAQNTAATAAQSTANTVLATTTTAVGAATTATSVAMQVLRGALIATGIGAFIVLLGVLIVNWDGITAAIKRLFPSLESVNQLWGKFVDGAIAGLKQVTSFVVDFGSKTLQSFKGYFTGIKDIIVGAFTLDGDQIIEGVKNIGESVYNLWVGNAISAGREASIQASAEFARLQTERRNVLEFEIRIKGFDSTLEQLDYLKRLASAQGDEEKVNKIEFQISATGLAKAEQTLEEAKRTNKGIEEAQKNYNKALQDYTIMSAGQTKEANDKAKELAEKRKNDAKKAKDEAEKLEKERVEKLKEIQNNELQENKANIERKLLNAKAGSKQEAQLMQELADAERNIALYGIQETEQQRTAIFNASKQNKIAGLKNLSNQELLLIEKTEQVKAKIIADHQAKQKAETVEAKKQLLQAELTNATEGSLAERSIKRQLIELERQDEIDALKDKYKDAIDAQALIAAETKRINAVKNKELLEADKKYFDANISQFTKDTDEAIEEIEKKYANPKDDKNTLVDETLQNEEDKNKALKKLMEERLAILEVFYKFDIINEEIYVAAKKELTDKSIEYEKAANEAKSKNEVGAGEKKRKKIYEASMAIANGMADVLAELSNQTLEREMQRIDTQRNAEMARLEQQKAHGLINEEQYQLGKDNIQKKYAAEEKKAKKEAAKRDKEIALFKATIDGIASVVAQPDPIMRAITAIFVATQIALLASKPLPQFNQGVKRLQGIGSDTSDSNLALLSTNEMVVKASTRAKYEPILNAIFDESIDPNQANSMVQIQKGLTLIPQLHIAPSTLQATATMGKGETSFNDAGIISSIQTMSKQLDKRMQGITQHQIYIDERGFNYSQLQNGNMLHIKD